MTRLAIRGGRLIDPANQIDAALDVFIADGYIIGIGQTPDGFQSDRDIDAHGQIVCPGLIDLCARLREPGQEHKATVASETRAAARGGITTLVCPPDTDPVIDETAVVELIHRRAQAAGFARVLPLGALTQGLRGEQLAELAALGEAGCIGVGDGGRPMVNTLVLRRALEYAATYNLTVFLTPADPWLSAAGYVHEGQVAAWLGLPGIPTAAETSMVARYIELIEDTGARAHFCRLSSARAVALLAEAQRQGLPVTADVSAHHLHLTEADLNRFDSLCHVLPPLRTDQDRLALRQGLASGVIGAICSDHQPHNLDAKEAPFGDTEPGASALETLLALSLGLSGENGLTLPTIIARLTVNPARILGLDLGHLSLGAPADVCIFNPGQGWRVMPETLLSQGKNNPFLGQTLPGQVTYTLLAGAITFPKPPDVT